MDTPTRLTLRRPDDWHVHLRDGAMLGAVIAATARDFGRAIVMPNLKPPVTTTALAAAYRERIRALVPADCAFTPLMTCYLTDTVDPADLRAGHADGVFTAAKLYPAGATTNSEAGVTDLARIAHVLETMEAIGMPLLVHGEVVDGAVDVFDREAVFVERVLAPLRARHPALKIVLEHVTTREGVAFVREAAGPVAATITPHHLMINRNAMFAGGIRPHMYCLPVAKREIHRLALREAACSGDPRFFLGTDSAPHLRSLKEHDCGCAGVFNAPSALACYAQVFAEEQALDRLEAFASLNGPAFYGLPANDDRVTLESCADFATPDLPVGDEAVRVFRPAGALGWRVAPGVTPEQLLALDRAHVWHPYSTLVDPPSVFGVEAAAGVRLRLADGRELIDGMASWWSVIHGYNHPAMNAAVSAQLGRMAHVMFGGLTHAPAVELAAKLVAITPAPLDAVFFADSGSVSVEVAIKMAIQYWAARGRPRKQRLLTVRGGYHGDTFAAMSVCDPVTGMHTLFQQTLAQQLFAPRPGVRYGAAWDEADIAEFARLLEAHREELAAVIIEPVVQGAGGMWFYAPEYLRRVRELCDAHGVLLILDEIATGFGRTGRLFACEHAGIAPDLMCLGKALTGGYMTLAATLATREVAETISRGEPGVFMHGPTFMANPLACAAALASVELLLGGPWAKRVAALEQALESGLAPARALPQVVDVRCLGGIGVIELATPVDMRSAPRAFVDRGVWVRPFGRLVYVMPAYVMPPADVATLTAAMCEVVATF